MENNLEKINNNIRHIKLTPKERNEAWFLIEKEISQYSVRTSLAAGHKTYLKKTLKMNYKNIIAMLQNHSYEFFTSPKYTMAILLTIAVLLTGGVSIASQDSLPGDTLYPVKLGVEEVQGILALSTEAKANWEVHRAQKRLEEAEKLAVEGSLDAEATAKIEANFEAQAQRVKERVEKFKSKESFNAAANVSLNFENALRVHDRILSDLSRDKSEIEVHIKPIRVKVRSEFKQSQKERNKMDDRVKERSDASVKASGSKEIKVHLDSQNETKAIEDTIEDIDEYLEGELNLELNSRPLKARGQLLF